MQANMIGQVCNGGTAEIFQRLRDFICKRNGSYDYSTTGIGWTLHDSYYATNESSCAINDWYVVKSTGEDGNRDCYYRIKFSNTSYLSVEGYLYWNNVSHTGNLLFSNGLDGINCIASGSMLLWLYGNLNYFMTITKVSGIYYAQYSGLLTKTWGNQEVARTVSGVVSGLNRTLSLDILPTTDWSVGKKIFIRDDEHVELISITYRDNVLKEIRANLTYSYNPGAKLCCSMSNFLSGPFSTFLSGGLTERLLIGKNGSITNTSDRNAFGGTKPTFVMSIGPDPQNGEYAVFPVTISCGTTSSMGYCGCLEGVRQIVGTNLVSEDVVTDGTNNWRAFNLSGSGILVIREV